MIRYRPFRNTDPPALVEIWRSQPPLRRRAAGIDVLALERFVLSKPYFEREGLIVAEEDGRPLGFAHAGFGPSPDGATLSRQLGVVSLLQLLPDVGEEVAAELLRRCEGYLRMRGAEQLYGGEHGRLCPFYTGLYGGSRPPGVLESDPAGEALRRAGYQPHDTTPVWERSLSGFRPPVDRQQMQIRRSCRVEARLDPPAASWWGACTQDAGDRAEFVLTKSSGELCGRALFSEMELFSQSWGVRVCGLLQLDGLPEADSAAHALFLLGESFRQLASQGVSLIEAQLLGGPRQELMQKLGLEVVDRGVAYRREPEGQAPP